MAVNYPTGYVDESAFQRIDSEYFIYHSPSQKRDYSLRWHDGEWHCNCPQKRKNAQTDGQNCKHEIALARMWTRHQARSKSLSMCQAEEAAARATRDAEQQEQIASLRAEVAELRGQLAEIQSQPAQQASNLADIIDEINALKDENTKIKKALATKATARKKHMRETEMAMAKELVNETLDGIVEQAQNTIQITERARQQIKDLEAIPHALKAELDQLTEQGKPELQPDYEPEERNSDEVRAEIRAIQEERTKKRAEEEKAAKKLADQMQERRESAPLNGNSGFQFLK